MIIAKSKNMVLRLVLTAMVSVSFTACGGRLPLKPADPATGPSDPAPVNPNPGTNPNNPNPQPSDNKPPANVPPGDGSGDLPNPKPPVTPNPPPPDPGQPQTDADFFELMKRFGFSKSKDDLVVDIKKGTGLKISDWSPGTVKNKDKNITAHFTDSVKYFNPALKNAKDYFDHSMQLAAKKDGIDFYLSVNFGPKKDTIDLLKVDAKTLEVLYYNKSGLISSYTQDNGKLLRLARFMLIPKTVYSAAPAPASTLSFANKW